MTWRMQTMDSVQTMVAIAEESAMRPPKVEHYGKPPTHPKWKPTKQPTRVSVRLDERGDVWYRRWKGRVLSNERRQAPASAAVIELIDVLCLMPRQYMYRQV